MKSLLLSLGTTVALTTGLDEDRNRPAPAEPAVQVVVTTDVRGALGKVLPLCISCWPWA